MQDSKNKLFLFSGLIIVIILIAIVSFFSESNNYLLVGDDTVDTGVFANLINESYTFLNDSGTDYAVQGLFNNSPTDNFYVDNSIPAIVYNGSEPIMSIVHWSVQASSSVPGVNLGVKIVYNGEPCDRCLLDNYMKFANQFYSWSGISVSELEQGDTVQIDYVADRNNVNITTRNFVVSINSFYR